MPPPPPPPPVGGPRIPRPTVVASKGGALDRGALLSSIEKGARLRKVTTNDRSGPTIDSKVKSATSTNGSSSGPPSGGMGSSSGPPSGGMGSVMANGGAPQLGGLFAGGMPKLRSTGRSLASNGPTESTKPSPPALPTNRKPSAPATPQPPMKSFSSPQNHTTSNGYLPPSPKPSSKSSPAPPPPPPPNRKPSLGGRAPPFLDIPNPSSKPAPPQLPTDASSDNGDRHPPLPAKPTFRIKTDRGAPPRPPNSSKPILPPKSPDLKPSNDSARRISIDRSKSLREPPTQNHLAQTRVGTSADSPAALFRANNHREAPPIPGIRPTSKTVGRAAGSRMAPALRAPTDRPPRPPVRPMVAAPPPPSQPPPPPPSHRGPKPEPPTSAHHNVPPPPPERNESTRMSSSRLPGDFESRYGSMFKSRNYYPTPLSMNKIPKTYPSRSNVKNQRRAPQPPSHAPPESHSNNNISMKPGPPPPPPHAPLHLQMERKFYGAEASHC